MMITDLSFSQVVCTVLHYILVSWPTVHLFVSWLILLQQDNRRHRLSTSPRVPHKFDQLLPEQPVQWLGWVIFSPPR